MVIPSKMVPRIGVLVAVTVVMGWLTLYIPNVELLTATVFLAGYWCGPWWGMLVGFLGEGLFSLTNPYGMPLPPLLFAQCIGMTLAGLAGGWVRRHLRQDHKFQYMITLAVIGLVVTFVFDVITTISFPIAMGLPLSMIWYYLISGVVFMAIHGLSNIVIFAVIVRLVITRIPRINIGEKASVGVIVILIVVFNIQAQEPVDSQPPPDSLQTVSDSLSIDSLVVPEPEYDNLPTLELMLAPGLTGDSLSIGRSMNRSQMLELGIEDMGDVVRYFPNTYPHDMATFGAYSSISIRAQFPRSTHVTLDGRTLNHRRNGLVDLNEIIVEEVEETYLEPISSSITPPATGGNIGFRSFLPMADTPFSRIAVRAGYYGFTTVDYHIAQRVTENWSANIAGQVGYFEDRGDSTEVESTHFRSHLTYRPTPLWTGRLSYYHSRAKNEIPFPVSYHKSLRNDLVLSIVRKIDVARGPRLELQTWVTDIHQNDSDIFREAEFRAGGQLRIVTPVCSTGSIWAGIFSEGWEIESGNNLSHRDHEFRLFGGASVPVVPMLEARTSLMYSVYKTDIREPAGSAAIQFQPISWVRLTGTAEITFRAPSYFEQHGNMELYLRDDLVEPELRLAQYEILISSGALDSEKSRTYSTELSLKLPWELQISFCGYQKELKNPIVFRPVLSQGSSNNYIQAQNGTATSWRGGYIAGKWAVWDSLELSGVASLNGDINHYDQFTPNKSGWAALTYRHTYFKGDLRVIGRLEEVYWIERQATKYLRTYTLPEVYITNFRISATIEEFTLFWGMNNLLSEDYELLGGFPMIHREEVYGIRWNFLE